MERLESRELLAADLYLTEFLASNSGGLRDGDGDSSDWIELFNQGPDTADLSGYFLTDNSDDLTKWAFPSGTTIAPGEFLLVFASDKGAAGPVGEIHTTYKLSAGGEYLGLVEPDGTTIVHDFAPEFPPQESNVSYGLSMTSEAQTLVDASSTMHYSIPTDGSLDAVWSTVGFDDSGWSSAAPGIGYENNPGGGQYAGLINAAVPSGTTSAYTRFDFHLSEASQYSTLALEMLYDDGFVAYLNGVEIASANAPANPVWNSTAGEVNRPDETVLDAYVRFDASAFVDLLADGENVLAVHALNQAASSDMLMIPRLVAGGARVVEPLAEGYFTDPTPDAPNPESLLGIVADTKFSVDRGFFDSPFVVEITTETAGATIVYTVDGSTPAVDENLNVVNGAVYTSELAITGTTNLRAAAFKAGYAPTNVDTQTYLFTSDIINQTHQSAIDAGLPSSWGSRSADYGLDPDVIGPGDLFGGVYAAQIEDSLKSIPTMSLTLDSDDFFGPSGIYANVTGSGVDWERATSAELIYPDGSEGFQVDAGLRVHGAASRTLSKKNALRLLFKSEYGDSKLRYPLFGEDGVDEFDTIVLRPHFNDGWGWDGALDDPLYVRDQWFRDTQAAMGHASSRGNLVHLYVNGLYWGLYNPSERPDDSFAAEHFGGDKSEYDVVYHNGLQDGSIDAYNTMIAIASSVSVATTPAAKSAAYQSLQGRLPDGSIDLAGSVWLDTTNYIDYMLLNHYGGNNDWPDRNWYSSRRDSPDSEGFRFFAWDSEISLALSSRTSLFENNLYATTGAAEAYGYLRTSEEFRIDFADRIHHHLFNGGALYVDPDNSTYNPANPDDNVPASRFAALADSVYDAMVAESARWGDQHVSHPRTRDVDWQSELDDMLGVYFRDRHAIVLGQWRNAGLYPDTNAPEFMVDGARQHGGVLAAGATISFEDTNPGLGGVTYYTTDGSDPRLIGGSVDASSAIVYSTGFSLSPGDTTIRARTLRDGEWSALTEAEFSSVAQLVENADFNLDGLVNAADYTLWRDNQGATGTPGLTGDANHDGVVDDHDKQVWREQYGSTPSAPTTIALAVAGMQANPAQLDDASDADQSLPHEAVLRSQAFASLANTGAHNYRLGLRPTSLASEALPRTDSGATIRAAQRLLVEECDSEANTHGRDEEPQARESVAAGHETSDSWAEAIAEWPGVGRLEEG